MNAYHQKKETSLVPSSWVRHGSQKVKTNPLLLLLLLAPTQDKPPGLIYLDSRWGRDKRHASMHSYKGKHGIAIKVFERSNTLVEIRHV